MHPPQGLLVCPACGFGRSNASIPHRPSIAAHGTRAPTARLPLTRVGCFLVAVAFTAFIVAALLPSDVASGLVAICGGLLTATALLMARREAGAVSPPHRQLISVAFGIAIVALVFARVFSVTQHEDASLTELQVSLGIAFANDALVNAIPLFGFWMVASPLARSLFAAAVFATIVTGIYLTWALPGLADGTTSMVMFDSMTHVSTIAGNVPTIVAAFLVGLRLNSPQRQRLGMLSI